MPFDLQNRSVIAYFSKKRVANRIYFTPFTSISFFLSSFLQHTTMAILQDSLNLAILLPQHDAQDKSSSRSITNYRRLPLSSNQAVLSLGELPETHLVSRWNDDRDKCGNQGPMEKACFKSARLSEVAANDAAVFLSGDYPGSRGSKKNRSKKPSMSPSALIADQVLTLSSSSGESTFRKAQYHAFTFSFPQAEFDLNSPTRDHQTYRQLLEIRQCGLVRSGALSLSKTLLSFESFDTVEICTGMCLFSEPNLNMCINNGTIRPDLLAIQPFSLSERDIIIRLATTIANMAALYIYGTNTRQGHAMRINIDIPGMQYYQSALESFESGKCSASDVLEWSAAIKKRRLLLFRAFRNAVEYALSQRGLKESHAQVSLSCGLQAAEETILRNVLTPQGPVDWIKEILKSLLKDDEEFWEEAINLQEEKEREPGTWRQFSTLSYVYEVLKPVLRAQKTDNMVTTSNNGVPQSTRSAPPSPKSSPPKCNSYFDESASTSFTPPRRVLLLAIDDQDESRIYTKTNRSLSQLTATSARSPGFGTLLSTPTIAHILTIYPAPQIVVGTSNPSAGWRRPSLWRAPLGAASEMGAEMQFQAVDGGSIDSSSDLLKKVYDADLVENLQSWLP